MTSHLGWSSAALIDAPVKRSSGTCAALSPYAARKLRWIVLPSSRSAGFAPVSVTALTMRMKPSLSVFKMQCHR